MNWCNKGLPLLALYSAPVEGFSRGTPVFPFPRRLAFWYDCTLFGLVLYLISVESCSQYVPQGARTPKRKCK